MTGDVIDLAAEKLGQLLIQGTNVLYEMCQAAYKAGVD